MVVCCVTQRINEKQSVIVDYESGRAIPNQQILAKLERALGEQCDWCWVVIFIPHYSLFLKSVTMYHLTRLTCKQHKYGCLDWKTDYIAWIRVPTKWEVHFKVYLCKRGENWPTHCWLKIFNSQAIQLPCAIILRVISLSIPLLYWIRVFLLSCVAPSDIIKLNFEGVVMG